MVTHTITMPAVIFVRFLCVKAIFYTKYDAVPMLNNRYNCCCRNNHDRLMILKHMWKGKIWQLLCNKLHTFEKTAQNFYFHEYYYLNYPVYPVNLNHQLKIQDEAKLVQLFFWSKRCIEIIRFLNFLLSPHSNKTVLIELRRIRVLR